MNELEQFRNNAEKIGLCDAFAQRWSNCKSKKQLFDLACDVNALAYLGKMIAKGHGLTSEYMSREFSPFLNGKYIHHDGNGYTSAIYCNPEGEIGITTACALIIAHNGPIRVDRPICELYIANSDCEIVGGGRARVYAYNSKVKQHNKD